MRMRGDTYENELGSTTDALAVAAAAATSAMIETSVCRDHCVSVMPPFDVSTTNTFSVVQRVPPCCDIVAGGCLGEISFQVFFEFFSLTDV